MILEGSKSMALFTAQNSEQELTTALTQVLLSLFIVRRALCKKPWVVNVTAMADTIKMRTLIKSSEQWFFSKQI